MRNTGILLFLVGIFMVINAGSFRDLVFGKATISFLNPRTGSSFTGGKASSNTSIHEDEDTIGIFNESLMTHRASEIAEYG